MEFVKKQNRKGFTLIEILIVIAIIGLLMAFLAPRFLGQQEKANISAAKIGLKQIQGAITLYKTNVGRSPERLIDLVEKPLDEKAAQRWRGPYLDDLPEDPWGNDFEYRKTPGEKHPYELYSEGPEDGEPISVWDK